MTKSFSDAADAEAVNTGLDQNAADMTPAIASIYGEEGAAAFVVEFAGFLDAATEGNLPQAAAEEAIRAHEADVISFFESFTAEGYDRMFDISTKLSGAIVA
ncbi:hypothetical protein [Jeotgalibacillus soli]|uniref:Uncharacterized protein n=1 Tax=Jeotgalibacillus soli TaxID=889306 RepID=A0A0C2V0U0_9BACL|nr:hypothetical protein [Jeotgalibacillus soli]KIL42682.1 hypothetical protein KP78_39050 [Jeotgalibacillus soli]